jgi:hypothetical protein
MYVTAPRDPCVAPPGKGFSNPLLPGLARFNETGLDGRFSEPPLDIYGSADCFSFIRLFSYTISPPLNELFRV